MFRLQSPTAASLVALCLPLLFGLQLELSKTRAKALQSLGKELGEKAAAEALASQVKHLVKFLPELEGDGKALDAAAKVGGPLPPTFSLGCFATRSHCSVRCPGLAPLLSFVVKSGGEFFFFASRHSKRERPTCPSCC